MEKRIPWRTTPLQRGAAKTAASRCGSPRPTRSLASGSADADVETSARQLIDYLGLEWNQNCLEFYNVDRPVKTASVTQVRKPIYKTSTNRWRKFEKYLGPLLEELGDIVPEYEAEIAHLMPKP